MSESNCKHPEVEVELTGRNSNVFALIGETLRAMRRANIPYEEQAAFKEEVHASEDYDGALQCIMRWVSVR